MLAPSLAAAPAHVGPVTAPGGNPGNSAGGIQKVQLALSMLQEALPTIPMGSPLHTEVLSFVKKAGEHLMGAQEDQQQKLMQLLMMAKAAQQNNPNAMLARIQGGGPPGAPPGAGAAPPGIPGAAPGALPPGPSAPGV